MSCDSGSSWSWRDFEVELVQQEGERVAAGERLVRASASILALVLLLCLVSVCAGLSYQSDPCDLWLGDVQFTGDAVGVLGENTVRDVLEKEHVFSGSHGFPTLTIEVLCFREGSKTQVLVTAKTSDGFSAFSRSDFSAKLPAELEADAIREVASQLMDRRIPVIFSCPIPGAFLFLIEDVFSRERAVIFWRRRDVRFPEVF